MLEDQLTLFTDRHEAIELFTLLRRRNPTQPWPLLPILSFIAPVGSGKSTLIEVLRAKYCSDPALPHIRLDFTLPDAPKDLLSILIAMRDKLQRKKDEHGNYLTFPRFDLGAAIALAAVTETNKRQLSRAEVQHGLSEGLPVLEKVGELSSALGGIVPLIPLIFVALKWAGQIQPLQALMRRLERGPGWRWYQAQHALVGLPTNPHIESVLERLHVMSTPGEPERKRLIEHLLPEAFLADIRDALDGPNPPKAWSKAGCLAIFLDGFEVLLDDSDKTGIRLLEVLALSEHRKNGETDPLLLVIGSQRDVLSRQQDPFEAEPNLDQQAAQERVKLLHASWQQRLSEAHERQRLRLRDLYLPLPLRDFGLEETRRYLQRFGNLYHTPSLNSDALVQDIYRVTNGQPLFLSLIATAVREAGAYYHDIDIKSLLASEDGERIGNDLLNLFLDQLSAVQKKQLVFSAVPRTLDADILRTILHLPNDIETEEQWRQYRELPFVRITKDKKKLVLHPSVRTLLLQKLPLPTRGAQSDYHRIHLLLKEHFQERIDQAQKLSQEDEQAQIEVAYHALALGDYEPTLQLALFAQQNNLTLWEPLLEAVAQAPTALMPLDIQQQATIALDHANLSHELIDVVKAIILYRWLLAAPGIDRQKIAPLWKSLGDAYHILPSGDRPSNLNAANSCYQRAFQILDTQSLTPLPQIVATGPLPTTPPPPITQVSANTASRASTSGLLVLVQSTFLGISKSKRALTVLLLALFVAVLTPLLLPFALSVLAHSHTAPTMSVTPLPSVNTRGIGVTIVHNQAKQEEYIGISDGSIPFDILRPDGAIKLRASQLFLKGHTMEAIALWQQAVQKDTNDAESLIYLENERIFTTNEHCAIFIVATSLLGDSSSSVNVGRDNLQGAYVAQKENNSNAKVTPVCVFIANLGSDITYAQYAPQVAQQIIKAMSNNPDIKGVMGWPGISDSANAIEAVKLLASKSIPIVSSANFDASLISQNLYHIVLPNQDQGKDAALYAEHLHKSRAVLFSDLTNTYSKGLAQGFKTRFEQDGNKVVVSEQYTTGQPLSFFGSLQDALRFSPDIIYFAGNAEDGRALLAALTQADHSHALRVLGGDELYQLVGYSSDARPGFTRLDFTAFAYPDEQSAHPMQHLYETDFDPADLPLTQQGKDALLAYGYSRPDNDAILSYDAMQVLVNGLQIAVATNPHFTPGDLGQAIASIQGLQGASRLISFDGNGELIDKTVIVLSVDQQGFIHAGEHIQ